MLVLSTAGIEIFDTEISRMSFVLKYLLTVILSQAVHCLLRHHTEPMSMPSANTFEQEVLSTCQKAEYQQKNTFTQKE